VHYPYLYGVFVDSDSDSGGPLTLASVNLASAVRQFVMYTNRPARCENKSELVALVTTASRVYIVATKAVSWFAAQPLATPTIQYEVNCPESTIRCCAVAANNPSSSSSSVDTLVLATIDSMGVENLLVVDTIVRYRVRLGGGGSSLFWRECPGRRSTLTGLRALVAVYASPNPVELTVFALCNEPDTVNDYYSRTPALVVLAIDRSRHPAATTTIVSAATISVGAAATDDATNAANRAQFPDWHTYDRSGDVAAVFKRYQAEQEAAGHGGVLPSGRLVFDGNLPSVVYPCQLLVTAATAAAAVYSEDYGQLYTAVALDDDGGGGVTILPQPEPYDVVRIPTGSTADAIFEAEGGTFVVGRSTGRFLVSDIGAPLVNNPRGYTTDASVSAVRTV